jgi:hypothetical protein
VLAFNSETQGCRRRNALDLGDVCAVLEVADAAVFPCFTQAGRIEVNRKPTPRAAGDQDEARARAGISVLLTASAVFHPSGNVRCGSRSRKAP